MKRIKFYVLTLISLLLLFSTYAYASTETGELKGEVKDVEINGKTYVYNTNTWYCVNGKFIDFNSNGLQMSTLKASTPNGDVNLLPIRGVLEALGAEITRPYEDYDDIYRIIIQKKYAVEVQVDSADIMVGRSSNGKSELVAEFEAQCPIVEYNDTIYVPFRDIIKACFNPTGDISSTDKYIQVSEIAPDSGFYRVNVTTSNNLNVAHFSELAHLVYYYTPDGKKKSVSVANTPLNDNFKKWLYNIYVQGGNVKTDFEEYKNYCSYSRNTNGVTGFVTFKGNSEIDLSLVNFIAPTSKVTKGTYQK